MTGMVKPIGVLIAIISFGFIPVISFGQIWEGSPYYIIPLWTSPDGYIEILDELPTGFQTCDGTNGTPNLMGRYLFSMDESIEFIAGSTSSPAFLDADSWNILGYQFNTDTAVLGAGDTVLIPNTTFTNYVPIPPSAGVYYLCGLSLDLGAGSDSVSSNGLGAMGFIFSAIALIGTIVYCDKNPK